MLAQSHKNAVWRETNERYRPKTKVEQMVNKLVLQTYTQSIRSLGKQIDRGQISCRMKFIDDVGFDGPM